MGNTRLYYRIEMSLTLISQETFGDLLDRENLMAPLYQTLFYVLVNNIKNVSSFMHISMYYIDINLFFFKNLR